MRAAIVNGGGATDFCTRFLDADEKPLTRFTLTLDAAAKPTARGTVALLTVKAPAIAYIRLSGPRDGEFLAADELRFVPLEKK